MPRDYEHRDEEPEEDLTLYQMRLRLGNPSQKEIANEMGVSLTTVHNWETGMTPPGASNMQKLIEFYLRKEAFTKGKELKEAKTLWHVSKVRALFNNAWFNTLLEQLRQEDKPRTKAPSLLDNPNSQAMLDENSASPDNKASPFSAKPERHWNIPATPSLSSIQRQNRKRLLKRVRADWIEDILEPSLHRAIWIDLYLQKERSDNSWGLVVQEHNHDPYPLPAGTNIVDVYDEANGELLILGEPGAGKTTLLLKLTSTLLERAENDEQLPMPIVFNLSSWAVKRQSLRAWLVEELQTKYGVPRKVGTYWIDNGQVLPLLDGLDEVATGVRSACAEQINIYHQFQLERGNSPMVVCCRRDEYTKLSTCVKLWRAVSILPLTDDQIDTYLEQIGEQAKALRQALNKDKELHELARQPLMLGILALAYQGATLGDIPTGETREKAPDLIFARYVESMLTRRGVNTRYSPQKTTRWLAILAKQMNQSQFSLEDMQPTWLPNASLRHLYISGGVRVPGILLGVLTSLLFISFLFLTPILGTPPTTVLTSFVLVGGLLGSLLSRTQQEDGSITSTRCSFKRRMFVRVIVAIITGIVMGIATFPSNPLDSCSFGGTMGVIGLGSSLLTFFMGTGVSLQTANQEEGEKSQRSMLQDFFRSSSVRSGRLVGIITFLSVILGAVLPEKDHNPWTNDHLSSILAVGLMSGLLLGLLSTFLSFLLADRSGKIQVKERLIWTWQSLWQSLKNRKHLENVLLFSILLLATTGLLILLFLWGVPSARNQQTFKAGLLVILSVVFSGAVLYWTLFGLFHGISLGELKEQERMVPNQGIHRSARNGLLYGFIGGSICLLVCILSVVSALFFGFMLYAILELGEILSILSTLSVGSINISPFLPSVLVFALASCLITALKSGWLACWRHYLLRWLLWFDGSVPWDYAQFLDYAVERLLLRKVGGGYIFIHRLLLDYLASLDISLLEQEASAIPAKENTSASLTQTPIMRQRRSTGLNIRVILFVEVTLLLALTCGVSFFGKAQQQAYNLASTATAQAYDLAFVATAQSIDAQNPYLPRPSAFVDPLSQPDVWQNESNTDAGGQCQFVNGAYQNQPITTKEVF